MNKIKWIGMSLKVANTQAHIPVRLYGYFFSLKITTLPTAPL